MMEEMRAAGVQPDEVAWTTLHQTHVNLSDVAGARAVMAEMCAAGVRANIVTWTTLLKAHVTLSDAAGARAVMAEMRAAGVQPDKLTWNTLRKVHVVSDVAGAGAAMEEMRVTGTQPRDARRSTSPLAMDDEVDLGPALAGSVPTFESVETHKLKVQAASYMAELRGTSEPAKAPPAVGAQKPVTERYAILRHCPETGDAAHKHNAHAHRHSVRDRDRRALLHARTHTLSA